MIDQMMYIRAAAQERRNEVERLLKESRQRRQIEEARKAKPKRRRRVNRPIWAPRRPARERPAG